MFRDITYVPERIGVEPGSRKMPKRIHKVGKHGEDILETVGYTDIYEERQLSKDSVDINRIVERYLGGDTAALDKSPGLYIDLTIMPENIHEMKNATVMAEQYFAGLPKKERDKYVDVEDFLARCTFGPNETAEANVKEIEPKGGEIVDE